MAKLTILPISASGVTWDEAWSSFVISMRAEGFFAEHHPGIRTDGPTIHLLVP